MKNSQESVRALASNTPKDRAPLRGFAPEDLIDAEVELTELKDSPIQPAWVLEGAPKTRVAILSDGSTDSSSYTVMWDCTAGRFNWFYDIDETVHILEGSVTLTLPSGATRKLVAGSTFFFPRGTQAEWKVDRYIRKVAFCHQPMPSKLVMAKRFVKAMKRLVRPGSAPESNMFGAA